MIRGKFELKEINDSSELYMENETSLLTFSFVLSSGVNEYTRNIFLARGNMRRMGIPFYHVERSLIGQVST